jgi:DNA-binding response OmpR family regulator
MAEEVKKKILLVEDEAALRDLYKEVLTDKGYAVSEAKDGEEAFDLMKKGGWDLILLDIVLPKIDGIEVLKRLKGEKIEEPNGPVIILTNLGQEAVIAEGVKLGIKGYLIKSDITPDQVITEIEKALKPAEQNLPYRHPTS